MWCSHCLMWLYGWMPCFPAGVAWTGCLASNVGMQTCCQWFLSSKGGPAPQCSIPGMTRRTHTAGGACPLSAVKGSLKVQKAGCLHTGKALRGFQRRGCCWIDAGRSFAPPTFSQRASKQMAASECAHDGLCQVTMAAAAPWHPTVPFPPPPACLPTSTIPWDVTPGSWSG